MAIDVSDNILWPSLVEARKRCFHRFKKASWLDSHTIAHLVSLSIIDQIHQRVKSFNNIIRVHYAMVIEGGLIHTPRIASQFWKQKHCIVEVMFIQGGVEEKWYVEGYGDMIQLQIGSSIDYVPKFDVSKKRPWYFYPHEKNPEYSKLSMAIKHKTHKRFNPVAYFQYEIWGMISDMIRSHKLKKRKVNL